MSQKILKKRKKMVSSAMNHLKKLSGSSWAQGKYFVLTAIIVFEFLGYLHYSQTNWGKLAKYPRLQKNKMWYELIMSYLNLTRMDVGLSKVLDKLRQIGKIPSFAKE